MTATYFEEANKRLNHRSQRKDSENLQKLAKKITKVPDSITIPKEYL